MAKISVKFTQGHVSANGPAHKELSELHNMIILEKKAGCTAVQRYMTLDTLAPICKDHIMILARNAA